MKSTLVILAGTILFLGCGEGDRGAMSGSDSAGMAAGHDSMGEDHGAMGHGDSSGGMKHGGGVHDMEAMNRMMVDHLGAADSMYDARFIDMMIPHHEGAVMMAKDALAKAGRPEMVKMANDIISSQNREIERMKGWRREWYGDDSPTTAEAGTTEHMREMNTMMTANLGGKDSLYEARFIDLMIPHHEGAVMMAEDALTKARHPELQKMSREIIDAQRKEISGMKNWLREWYGR